MRLDLGGIAKGFAADAMLTALAEQGIASALIAAGGDVRAGAPPPGRSGWGVRLATLNGKGEVRRVCNAALSTSGDLEQYVEIGGTRYSHIVDPATGLGLTRRISASVLAPSGALADGLATALSVLGPERGFEVLDGYADVEAVVTVLGDKGPAVHRRPRR